MICLLNCRSVIFKLTKKFLKLFLFPKQNYIKQRKRVETRVQVGGGSCLLPAQFPPPISPCNL